MRPTLIHITMNSRQNIKNNYLKILENEKQANSKGKRRVNTWKKVMTLVSPFYGFWLGRSQSMPWEVTKIQIKTHAWSY